MMLEAVFSAVLAGQPKASLEEEKEEEDEQRNRVKMSSDQFDHVKFDTGAGVSATGDLGLLGGLHDAADVSSCAASGAVLGSNKCGRISGRLEKIGKVSWDFDSARMFCNTGSKAIQPSIFNRVGQQKLKIFNRVGQKKHKRKKTSSWSDQFDDVGFRGRWKVEVGKDWTEEEFEEEEEDEEFEDEDEDGHLIGWGRLLSVDQQKIIRLEPLLKEDFTLVEEVKKSEKVDKVTRMESGCFASERSITRNIKDITDFKLSVDQQKIIRKQGTDMDIFWCIVDALAQECNHGKFSDVRRHEDQFFALIGDTVSAANGQSISSNYCGHAGGFVNLSRTAPQTGGLAAMKSLGTECVNFSVTESSLQNRAHRISSADASGRLRPEVDTGFCSPLWVLDSGGAPPPWIYDTGASFSLTEDLCIPLPPRPRPRGLAQHNLHRPRALSIQRLPRRRHAAHVWIYDTGASFSLTEDLCILLPPRHRPRGLAQHNLQRPRGLAQHNLQRPRGLAQHNLQRPRALSIQRLPRRRHAAHVWIYDTGASFSLTENLSLLQPEPELHHLLLLSPVWIYDTGASFSLTGDLSLLPGVCSTGDCSPFLGLRHPDPVSAANGQSVVSNKCGRASGTLNLSRTAPQTTGLISSSEPIAADNSSLLTPETTPEQTWRVASAAPQHMTGYLNHLIDYTPASGDQVIDTPNMGRMAVHGRGSVNTANITLQDVLYVPCLDANLVSTGQLAQLGYMITLGPYGCRIYKDDEDMPLVGEAHYVDGYLLELDFLRVRPSTN